MKIYNYHYQTFEFINESEADESPLEPGVFLVPANATTKKPIANKKGFAVTFVNNNWNYIEDYRNQTWFDKNGNSIEIKFLGNPADKGLLKTKPDIPDPIDPRKIIDSQKSLSFIISEWMDKKAIQYGYYSCFSAISYAEEPAVPLFQKQGQAFRKWRSLVWQAALPLINSIEKGEAKIPADIESYLKTLPQIVVPEV